MPIPERSAGVRSLFARSSRKIRSACFQAFLRSIGDPKWNFDFFKNTGRKISQRRTQVHGPHIDGRNQT